jgi:F-type H+-transporting ATPase subunit beta
VGERSREAQELLENLKDAGVLDQTVLMIGQMGEKPSVRFRTAFAGVAISEFFRDKLGKDVLFFLDNAYRFSQAGYELSTLMNAIPSEDGYQPTLPSEIGELQERLTSTEQGSITSIEAVYVPSDDVTDLTVRSVFPFLDVIVVLSRDVYQEGRYPAIDLLASTSSTMSVEIVGQEHYDAFVESKKLLEQAVSVERLVSLVGLTELSRENQVTYIRATLLKNYMTQRFFVTEAQSGRPGVFVPIKQTVADVKRILSGEFDGFDAERFLQLGSLDELTKDVTTS